MVKQDLQTKTTFCKKKKVDTPRNTGSSEVYYIKPEGRIHSVYKGVNDQPFRDTNVLLYTTCADQESFVRGVPTLTTLF